MFDFINGLCHHVTFLLPPFTASLLSVSLLGFGKGAKHLKEQQSRLSATIVILQRWLSALLEQRTGHFHLKDLFLSELHRFL